MYKRAQFFELFQRLKEPRFVIQAVVGPRQVGKSTMVKQVLDEIEVPYMFVSADNVDSDNNQWIGETWESVRANMHINSHEEFILAIDEIHKIKNWSEAIKKEWDYDSMNNINIKVVLLGSSRLLIKDGLSESLMGRYEFIRMPHWYFDEVSTAFGATIEEYIYFGGYPGGYRLYKNETRWKKYLRDSIIVPSIEKDIFLTKKLYKPALMKQVFELGCLYSGKEISYTKIVGQLQDAGNTTTVSNYINLLDQTQLLAGLKKYANDNARQYSSVPKFAVYDTALLSALSNVGYKEAYITPEIWGRWVESSVGAFLLNKASEYDFRVFYWREKDYEVDFVVEYNNRLTSIEVKSGFKSKAPGYSEFIRRFNPEHKYLIGREGISLTDFFKASPDILF